MWKVYAMYGAMIIGSIAIIVIGWKVHNDQWKECREQFSRSLCQRIMYLNDE